MASGQEKNWEGYELSGWWKRVGAQLIDGLIIFVAALVVLTLFAAIFVGLGALLSNQGDDVLAAVFILFLIFSYALIPLSMILLYMFYYGKTMSRSGEKNGQSWGKEVLRIAVKREDGKEVDFAYSVMRQVAVMYLFFGFFLSIFTLGIAPLLNYLWPLWDDKRQALHDKMASSRVVVSAKKEKTLKGQKEED